MDITTDTTLLFFVIIIFSLIQSLFGVGLLLFGTPTLLLLDYSFVETLSFLIPCSIVISILQVYNQWSQIDLYRLNVFYYLLPMAALGLTIILYVPEVNLFLIIGVMLLLTSFVRLHASFNRLVGKILAENFRSGLLMIGLIHGLTNLGGAPLVAITSTIFNKKVQIQSNIAYAYFTMALVQLSILVITGEFVYSIIILVLAFFSGLVYLSIGKYVFENATDIFYKNILTFFIFLYGVLLISNSF